MAGTKFSHFSFFMVTVCIKFSNLEDYRTHTDPDKYKNSAIAAIGSELEADVEFWYKRRVRVRV